MVGEGFTVFRQPSVDYKAVDIRLHVPIYRTYRSHVFEEYEEKDPESKPGAPNKNHWLHS